MSQIVKKIMPFFAGALIVLSCLVAISTSNNPDLMKSSFSHYGYFLIFVTVIMWLIVLIGCCKAYAFSMGSFMRNNWQGVLLAFIMTLIISVSVEPKMRVLSDEANLLSISKTLAYEKRADNVTMGKYDYERFVPTTWKTPKRPLLFPFLVSVMHSVTGFQIENVFIFNYGILFLSLVLIASLVKKHINNMWAFSTVFMVCAYPIVSQNASSGGFDLFAAFFMLVNFLILKWFLESPQKNKFVFLWTSLLLLTNIRHEGIVTFFIVMFLLTVLGYVKKEYFSGKTLLVYAFTPFVLLITFWQRILTKDPFENKGIDPFSFSNFIDNNLMFLRSFLHHRFVIPYATIINLTGFIGGIMLLFLVFKGEILKEKYKKHLLLICSLCLMFNWGLYTSFFNGKFVHPSSSRYYVLFCVVLALVTIMALYRIAFFKKRPKIVLMMSVVVFLIYHPVSVQDNFTKTQTLPREYRYVNKVLSAEEYKDEKLFVISARPVHFTSLGMGAVTFKHANKYAVDIMKDQKSNLFDKIIVVQRVHATTQKPKKGMALSPNYTIQTITETMNKYPYKTRISEVTKIEK